MQILLRFWACNKLFQLAGAGRANQHAFLSCCVQLHEHTDTHTSGYCGHAVPAHCHQLSIQQRSLRHVLCIYQNKHCCVVGTGQQGLGYKAALLLQDNRDFRDSSSGRHEAHARPDLRQTGTRPPDHSRDFDNSRPGRHEAVMRSDPRQSGAQPPQHPRRPFTRDGSASRAPSDSADRYQNTSMERGAEVPLPHPRGAPPIRHMGPPDAALSHGPAAGRDPLGNPPVDHRSARGYGKPYSTEGHMHPDSDRAEHGRSASHGRGAGSRGWPDSRVGYDSTERRAGGNNGAELPPMSLGARGPQPSETRPRHRQPDAYSDVAPGPHR